MHVRRLCRTCFPGGADAAFDAELPRRISRRCRRGGCVAADPLTDLCDRLAFSFCFEEADRALSSGSGSRMP
jgi:hypothetical protein